MESDSPELIRTRLLEELRSSMIYLPEGIYLRGGERPDEQPVREIITSPFGISKYQVTIRQYCDFLNAIGIENELDGIYLFLNTVNKMSRVVKDGVGYVPLSGVEVHPVICVSWIGALAFAIWLGGRLPTEAEWERAARGINRNSIYPWGNEAPNQNLANFAENVGYTTPVGSYPPNSVGLFDMAGNVFEWCMDWHKADYYKNSPQKDPLGPKDGLDKVIRGGAWAYMDSDLRCATRRKRWPRIGGTNLGFRVVYDVSERRGRMLEKSLRLFNPLLSKPTYQKLRKELLRFKDI